MEEESDGLGPYDESIYSALTGDDVRKWYQDYVTRRIWTTDDTSTATIMEYLARDLDDGKL